MLGPPPSVWLLCIDKIAFAAVLTFFSDRRNDDGRRAALQRRAASGPSQRNLDQNSLPNRMDVAVG